MKSFLLFIAILANSLIAGDHASIGSRFCHKWVQVGLMSNGEKTMKPIDKSMAEVIEYKEDGTDV
jgi:hypothetical protein